MKAFKLICYFILLSLFQLDNVVVGQTTYTTISDGAWNALIRWDANGKPPNTISSGDSIIIKNNMLYDASQVVQGVMLIESGASIIGASKDLNIGGGAIDQGELINYGIVLVRDLKVKPDNGCTPTNILPAIYNYGNITTSDDLHIGNNCGAGAFYNYSGAKLTVTDQIHLDNYLCNTDTILVGTLIKLHGGTLDCCGYIETPYLDIDMNNGRAGTLGCTNICQPDGNDPIINIDGDDYSDLSDAVDNAPSSEVSIDPDSTYICGFNSGNSPLPIKLLSFTGKFDAQNKNVRLEWITVSEINNDFFTIERSQDAFDWEMLTEVEGSGNASVTNYYLATDNSPFSKVTYYRLKQTDYDGKFNYSDVISVVILNDEQTFEIYPNLTHNHITIDTKQVIKEVSILDVTGNVVKIVIPETNIIEVVDLPGGVYFIKIVGEENTAIHKFVKQ